MRDAMYLDTSEPRGNGSAPAPLAAVLTTLVVALTAPLTEPGDPPAPDSLDEVLRRLRDLVPGPRAASLVATNPALRGPAGTALATIAATDDLARSADRHQLAAGAGPSVDARQQPVHAGPDDLVEGWPEVGARLSELGFTAALALPLPGLGDRGALTFYGDAPFPVDAFEAAQDAAAVAAVALVALQARER